MPRWPLLPAPPGRAALSVGAKLHASIPTGDGGGAPGCLPLGNLCCPTRHLCDPPPHPHPPGFVFASFAPCQAVCLSPLQAELVEAAARLARAAVTEAAAAGGEGRRVLVAGGLSTRCPHGPGTRGGPPSQADCAARGPSCPPRLSSSYNPWLLAPAGTTSTACTASCPIETQNLRAGLSRRPAADGLSRRPAAGARRRQPAAAEGELSGLGAGCL